MSSDHVVPCEEQRRVRIDRDVCTVMDIPHHSTPHGKTCATPEIHCSTFTSILTSTFPVISWVSRYPRNFRQWLQADILAGLTVGIMHIALGIANAMLSSLPPIYGLYTSFFPGLVYTFMGTSPHISLGTLILSCAMLGNVVDRVMLMCDATTPMTNTSHPDLAPTGPEVWTVNSSDTGLDTDWSSPCTLDHLDVLGSREYVSVQIALSVTFVIATLQLLLFLLRLGSLTSYLSQPVVSAFMAAASVHMVSSQVKHVLGLQDIATSVQEPILNHFRLIKLYMGIFEHITDTNWATLIISIISGLLLFACKELHLRFNLRFPIPYDLILVSASTTLSYFLHFNAAYEVSILGNIPMGLPSPSISKDVIKIVPEVIVESISIGIVIVTLNLSTVKLFQEKHKDLYALAPNQEILSYSVANFVGIPFQCFVSAAGLPRCVVLEALGAKTQLASFISIIIVLITLLWLAALLEFLPNAILAVIIIIALKNLILQHRQIYSLYFLSKTDWICWLVTWLVTLLTTIDIGLYTGIAIAILTIVCRLQRGQVVELQEILQSGIYVPVPAAQDADNNQNDEREDEFSMRIVRLPGAVCYLNSEAIVADMNNILEQCKHEKLVIILDMSTVTIIDLQGVAGLKQFCKQVNDARHTVKMSSPSDQVLRFLEENNFFSTKGDVHKKEEIALMQKCLVYPTLLDAVNSIPIRIGPVSESQLL